MTIEPKALNVLIFLVQHPGRLIERRELLAALWGDAFVTDHVLNRSIGQLRKVLGDDPREPRLHRDRANARLPVHSCRRDDDA